MTRHFRIKNLDCPGGDGEHSSGGLIKEIAPLAAAAAVFTIALWRGGYPFYTAAYILAAYPVLMSAVKTIFSANFLNEFSLMSFASLAAIAIGKFPEAVSVMLFYRTGELLQELAANRARRSIKSLAEGKPVSARVRRGSSDEMISPELVQKGDFVVVKPGEKIPVDGIVAEGASTADLSPLTGESMPVPLTAGDRAYGGTVNMSAGSISGNHADHTGGGISLASGSPSVTISGTAVISNNKASYGGGINIDAGTVTMSGGTISGNTATSTGGGISIGSSPGFVMSGGTIYGSEAVDTLKNTCSSGAALYTWGGTAKYGDLTTITTGSAVNTLVGHN
jgi:parallel beta-helix repeat protein